MIPHLLYTIATKDKSAHTAIPVFSMLSVVSISPSNMFTYNLPYLVPIDKLYISNEPENTYPGFDPLLRVTTYQSEPWPGWDERYHQETQEERIIRHLPWHQMMPSRYHQIPRNGGKSSLMVWYLPDVFDWGVFRVISTSLLLIIQNSRKDHWRQINPISGISGGARFLNHQQYEIPKGSWEIDVPLP